VDRAGSTPARPRPRTTRPATRTRGRTSKTILLYGATGYTGQLVARQASDRKLPVVLAGRNPARLRSLSDELRRPFRSANLEIAAEIDRALEGVGVVINAAGPFSATAAPLVEACLRARVHYLDISGEVEAIETVCRYDAAARRTGVMLMPGAGFDVVPSDCLALRVARRLPAARHLRIAISGLQLVSRGSARTISEQLGRGVRVRRDAKLATIPEGTLEAHFDFGAGPRACTCVSWGDVVTAFHTTGIGNVEVYFETTPAIRAFQWMASALAVYPPAAMIPRLWMDGWMQLQPEGPSQTERRARHAVVVAEARAANGQVVRSRARLPEAYSFTAVSAPLLASRVLAGEIRPGFQTPASVFGADLLGSFEDVRIEDIEGFRSDGLGI
jgi:short subunit dehydrogenase-like uncharacterized protein